MLVAYSIKRDDLDPRRSKRVGFLAGGSVLVLATAARKGPKWEWNAWGPKDGKVAKRVVENASHTKPLQGTTDYVARLELESVMFSTRHDILCLLAERDTSLFFSVFRFLRNLVPSTWPKLL